MTVCLSSYRFNNCSSRGLAPSIHWGATERALCPYHSLDFSKAFDTLRHMSLSSKLLELGLPDNVYNWVISFLSERSHCTKRGKAVSSSKSFNAGVVQGSALGPASCVPRAYSRVTARIKCLSMQMILICWFQRACLTRSLMNSKTLLLGPTIITWSLIWLNRRKWSSLATPDPLLKLLLISLE